MTREQMAVFLLKAKYGSGYAPPACTAIFTDVPCPSQYANWIVGTLQRGHHGRLRRRELLPGEPEHARPDGRLPRQDVRPAALRPVAARPPLGSLLALAVRLRLLVPDRLEQGLHVLGVLFLAREDAFEHAARRRVLLAEITGSFRG